MRTIELQAPGGIENLKMVERPTPAPGRQEILIKVRASALNYRDVEIARGSYHTKFALPLVLLSDGVGEVVAVGSNAKLEGRTKYVDRAYPNECRHPAKRKGACRGRLGKQRESRFSGQTSRCIRPYCGNDVFRRYCCILTPVPLHSTAAS